MTIFEAILFGLIQGVTELLPVSSSGHLVIMHNIFQLDTDSGMLYNVFLHIGTLTAICFAFYKDILKLLMEFITIIKDSLLNLFLLIKNRTTKEKMPYIKIISNTYRRMVLLITVASIPTLIIGYASTNLIKVVSANLLVPGICLLLSGILLFIADFVEIGDKKPKSVTYTNSFIIGICQGISMLPGLTRSGITITACLLSGFKPKFALKYSFLISIPAILGAIISEMTSGTIETTSLSDIPISILGMLIAAFTGFLCIKFMFEIIQKKKFKFFAFYCFGIGILTIAGHFIFD